MKRLLALALACGMGALIQTGAVRASGVVLTLVPVGMDNPVGVDWLPRGPNANELLVSEHYLDGQPFNFLHANPTTTATGVWGTQSGWNNEIYFNSVRPGQGAGWQVGDVYSAEGDAAGGGNAASIARFAADGTLLNANFATLVQTKDGSGHLLATPIVETKQKRGGVEFDRFGVAGNDLIVIAANDLTGPSDVYRINSAGAVTHLAHVDVHLEGVTTIPNDPSLYGPWAGQILVGDEFDNQLWTIDPNSGATAQFGSNQLGMPGGQTIKGEDLWVIPANSTFYGIEFGEIAGVHRLWKADKLQWTGRVGQVLVAQEYYAQLYAIRWDPTLNGGVGGFVSDLINSGSPDGTTGPAHWEHITFVPDPAAIGDRVWHDLNANGVQDAGEPGIGGATVQLYTSDTNALVATTATDTNGIYSFSGLVPDSYYVKFATPAGFSATPANVGNDAADSDAVNGTTGVYTLGPGETNLTVDAGFYKPASLSGFVYVDANNDGIKQGTEAPIAGVVVSLTGTDGNGSAVSLVTTTDGAGAWSFPNLVPGTYTVTETQPAGYLDGKDTQGTPGTGTTSNDQFSAIVLGSGVDGANNNFGELLPAAPASIGDFVWHDLNNNGIQDAGEPGLFGVTVTLLNCDGTPTGLTTTTGNTGAYSFTSLAAGCYKVQFSTPSGFTPSPANQGANDALDSDAVGGVSGNYTLNAGDNNLTVDAGFYQPVQPCEVTETRLGACSGFSLLALNGGTMIINSSTSIVGDVGYSANVTSGTNQKIDSFIGTAYIHSTANVTITTATYQPSGGIIKGGIADTRLNQANADAAAAATYYAGLPSSGNLGNVAGTLNLSAAGAVTVFDAANWSFNTNTLTLNGNSGSVFVFRVTGTFDWADSQTILNGVVPANVVFYFPNASAIKVYKATNVFAGTILAPTGSVIYHNPATFNGRIIAKNIDVHSDFNIAVPLCPTCVNGTIGGVDLGGVVNKELFFFANGSVDANWQGASKGFAGNVVVNGKIAKERTSGTVPYAGTISTSDSTLSAWQAIVDQNASQASSSLNQIALVSSQRAKLVAAFQKINGLAVTAGFAGRSAASLDGLNTTGGGCQTTVINVTSGLQVSSPINITGDACDVFILRWDTDQNFANGYQGQVKFQSGGAIVPLGGLKASNFIHVAGDINASGGGSTPTANAFPQGPRLNDGTGALVNGGANFNGGGFFTGYWLTTGAPTTLDSASGLYFGNTAPLSNAIFVGGWYTLTDKFSMTSGTSGVYVSPNCR